MDNELGVVDETDRRLRECLEREQRIAELHRQINRLQAEIVELTAQTEDDRSYALTGAVTTSEWLVGVTNVSARTARSWVRASRTVADLPEVAEGMVRGDLGVEQANAITRFLDGDERVEIQRSYFDRSADELADIARENRVVPAEQVRKQRFDRYHHGRYTDGGLTYEYDGKLPGAEGAIIDKALKRLADRDRIDEHGEYKVVEQGMADAMVEMASQALGRESDPDRSTVVVHVSAAVLSGDAGVGYTDDDALVPARTVRRMLCDGRIQVQLDGDDGRPLGVGRAQRTIPPWLQRIVRKRDRTCRFPGCRRQRWVHSHHMVHWADGGPTDIDNLITLCGFHHRVLHEEGWSVRFDEHGKLEWTTTYGLVYRDISWAEPVVSGERLRQLAAGPGPGPDPPFG